jgi:hypothetical protein
MPYTVWGRKPHQRDYAYHQIGIPRLKSEAITLAKKYKSLGYTAVHIRHDQIIGFIKDDGEFYQPPKKGRKK